MATWLVKTEPGDYAFTDLVEDGRATWDGVSNNAALMHMRRIRKGDSVLVYHTGNQKALVGLARAASGPREDPAKPGLNGKGEIAAPVFDLEPVAPAKTPVTLAALKSDGRFEGLELIRQPRLSVMPVSDEHARLLRKLAGFE